MSVDHRNPLHDDLCRCRACKPPLVGARSDSRRRAVVATILGAAVLVFLKGYSA